MTPRYVILSSQKIAALIFLLYFPIRGMLSLCIVLEPARHVIFGLIMGLSFLLALMYFCFVFFYRPYKTLILHFLFVCMLICMVAVVLYNFYIPNHAIPPFYYGKLFSRNINVIYDYLLLFLIGYFFRSQAKLKFFEIILFIVFVLVAASFIIFNPSLTDPAAQNTVDAAYLLWGDSFAIYSIYILSKTMRKLWLFALILVSVCMLYLLHSRTSFYCYLATIFILSFWVSWKLSLYLFLIVLCAFIGISIMHHGALLDSRMFGFIATGHSVSLDKRTVFLIAGWSDIQKHFLMGSYGGQILLTKGIGSYIHNYLSLWRQFGLFVFLIFVYFIFVVMRYIVLKVFSQFKISEINPMQRFFVLFSVFIILEVILGRSYTTPYIWMSVGMIIRYLDEVCYPSKIFIFNQSVHNSSRA